MPSRRPTTPMHARAVLQAQQSQYRNTHAAALSLAVPPLAAIASRRAEDRLDDQGHEHQTTHRPGQLAAAPEMVGQFGLYGCVRRCRAEDGRLAAVRRAAARFDSPARRTHGQPPCAGPLPCGGSLHRPPASTALRSASRPASAPSRVSVLPRPIGLDLLRSRNSGSRNRRFRPHAPCRVGRRAQHAPAESAAHLLHKRHKRRAPRQRAALQSLQLKAARRRALGRPARPPQRIAVARRAVRSLAVPDASTPKCSPK